MEHLAPPCFLYHGTTTAAAEEIMKSGAIRKMGRHAVHMQADPAKAWQSALRWKKVPVVLKIDAASMHRDGYVFGRTENQVWCTETVPIGYIAEQLTEPCDSL
jgi:putative RNA 2'-phosphotransferase